VNIRINFTSPETRVIVLSDAENCTIFIRLDRIGLTLECDGRTDRQTARSYYSELQTRCKNRNISPKLKVYKSYQDQI